MTDAPTISNPPPESIPLPELPADFFSGIRPTPPKDNRSWEYRRDVMRGMLWYDSIIDDILAHPGTKLNETAARLNKAPNTIYLIVGSDLFKARWAQRRAKFNDDLDLRLTGKIAKVAELALDATITTLEKKQDAVPLQQLKEISKDALDRLGYGPSTQAPQHPSVVIHNNPQANAAVANQVSGESLARAREAMRQLNDLNSSQSAEVEGSAVRVEEKG